MLFPSVSGLSLVLGWDHFQSYTFTPAATALNRIRIPTTLATMIQPAPFQPAILIFAGSDGTPNGVAAGGS